MEEISGTDDMKYQYTLTAYNKNGKKIYVYISSFLIINELTICLLLLELYLLKNDKKILTSMK